MCLYIITQQTGAALHRVLDVEGARERLRSHFTFPSLDKPMLALLTAHSARSLIFFSSFYSKSTLTLFHAFQKPTADVSPQKIIYVKTKW